MAQQTIGIGSTANDGTGDALRTAFGKCNTNFTELYFKVDSSKYGDDTGSALSPFTGQRLLLTTFKAVGTGEVFLYTSSDGSNWNAANSGNPVYTGTAPDNIGPTSLAYIDGRYYMASADGDYGDADTVKIMRSSDATLTSWTDYATPNVLPGSIGDRKYIWPPRWFVDDDGTVYLLYTIVREGGTYDPGELWAVAATNRALTTWGTPFQLDLAASANGTNGAIDPWMTKINGTYYLMYSARDTGGGFETRMTTARSLSDEFTTLSGFANLSGIEAAFAIPLPNGRWRIYGEDGDASTDGLKFKDTDYGFIGGPISSGMTPFGTLGVTGPLHHGSILIVGDSDWGRRQPDMAGFDATNPLGASLGLSSLTTENKAITLTGIREDSSLANGAKWKVYVGSGNAGSNPAFAIVSGTTAGANLNTHLLSARANGGIYAGYGTILEQDGLGVYCGGNLKIGGTFDGAALTVTGQVFAANVINTTGASAAYSFADRDDAGHSWFLYANGGAAHLFEGGANRFSVAETTGNVTLTGSLIVPTQTPASASATGTAGMIAWDSSYIYVCTATDTWKRVAVATW